jgi:hypothetical protein
MRIVCMADTHQFHHELTVPAGDLLVHAGDFCRRGDLGECQQFADWWNYLPHRHKVLVPGNHEFCFQKQRARAFAMFPGTHCLLDAEVTLGGARIYGSPWQPRYLDWAFNLPRGEALAARWARIPAGLHLLVTHGPPHGTGDRTSHGERAHRGGPHSGCEDLRDRVAQVRPALHVYGHVHEDGGAWDLDGCMSANVTTWECERGCSVFDLELDRNGGGVTAVLVPERER